MEIQAEDFRIPLGGLLHELANMEALVVMEVIV
jgi:hypothetical protein